MKKFKTRGLERAGVVRKWKGCAAAIRNSIKKDESRSTSKNI